MDQAPRTDAPPPEPAAPTRRKRSRLRTVLVRLFAVLLAIVAGVAVAVMTVDLGPELRGRAEREGSKYLQRPMHIGRLSAKLRPGVFVVEDLVIEGLTPTDRPFLTAKRITVHLPWWTAFSRKLVIESIEMTDWRMVVETFPNGRHNFPRLTRERRSQAGPRRFTTTLKHVVASRGEFTYDDHVTPWSTIGRNLTVTVERAFNNYQGRASFSNGTVKIQSYLPFRADMQSRFSIDGSKIHFDRIDLISDGARSTMDGDLDLARWPEQIYRIKSEIDFPTQKNIFFHRETFKVSGRGNFRGTFHLFRGGRELKGTFTSPLAGVNDWRFPDLQGAVLWVPDRMEVTNATSGLYGGTARFDYRLAPLGGGRKTFAKWTVEYRDVDLARLTDFLETQGLRLAGRISGRNYLEWPLGAWRLKTGNGEVVADAGGVHMMTRALATERAVEISGLPPEAGPFVSKIDLGYVPIAGRIPYRIDPEWISLGRSTVATERTYVEFEGRTAYGERSNIPFHVTSLDWQESDRILAGIMTAFGAPTGAVPIGGYGEFDGVMLNAFNRPRIEGVFSGDGMRAWDVVWGRGTSKVIIENAYAHVTDTRIISGNSEITAEGKFSLGYPRRDGGDEIDARVRITRRPLADLRHAFELDDYPVEGLVSGEYHLYGKYETPFGYGKLTIEQGVAYGEPFEVATAALRFEGAGVRLDAIDLRKSTGTLTGAAWVGWDGTYSFNADGRRIAVESVAALSFRRAPLSGLMQLNATGAGTFDVPRYDVKLRVDDLFAGDEGIGSVTGRLSVRGELLTMEFEAASPRLAVSGSGRIALTPEMDAELTVRFEKTSLDPYVRFFEPRLSPFTTAVAGGTVRVVGELAEIDHLVVDTRVEQLDVKLFDYRIRNDGPIELTLDRHLLQIGRMRVVGDGTQLEVTGEVALHNNRIAVQASGDANLGVLQGLFRDIRSSGIATLKAEITGPLEKPIFGGSATIADGRLRHFSLPHSLEAINGRVSFDAGGVRLDDVRARLGGGDVTFGGRIALNGFTPGALTLTAVGENMRVRYPEGFNSIIDADLALQGDISAPLLRGKVTVHSAVWTRRFEPNAFAFTGGTAATGLATPTTQTFPLRFDLQIDAPSSLQIKNNVADVVSSAQLQLQGTYDRPMLTGRADIERGNVIFEGNRYTVTRGSIGFFNPARIEPFFDVEAETRVRLPGQTYRITFSVTGTASQLSFNPSSDPPLPLVDIVSLLLGQTTDVQDAELRALRPGASTQSEEALLRALSTRLLTSPISAPVGRVVEQTLGVEMQIAPSLGTESDPLTPSARLILGRRISNRAYITFARALGTAARDQIIVLEYDQNDRVGWVITQTGDRTFAVDFRVRHTF